MIQKIHKSLKRHQHKPDRKGSKLKYPATLILTRPTKTVGSVQHKDICFARQSGVNVKVVVAKRVFRNSICKRAVGKLVKKRFSNFIRCARRKPSFYEGHFTFSENKLIGEYIFIFRLGFGKLYSFDNLNYLKKI